MRQVNLGIGAGYEVRSRFADPRAALYRRDLLVMVRSGYQFTFERCYFFEPGHRQFSNRQISVQRV